MIVLTAFAVMACDVKNNTETLAAAYINAVQKMDSVKILEFSDYKGEYENGSLKKAAKANLDLNFSELSKEKKLELKTYKFKSYEKLDSLEVEIIEEIDGETITITEKETGKITTTYKKDGKGEVLEKTETVTFFKVNDKWYLNLGQ